MLAYYTTYRKPTISVYSALVLMQFNTKRYSILGNMVGLFSYSNDFFFLCFTGANTLSTCGNTSMSTGIYGP